jgi:uncharacterized protein
MKGESSGRLSITKNLIVLERGQEELLLVNSFHLQPLYIQTGRAYVKQVLAASKHLDTRDALLEAFPKDGPLLELLLRHRILIRPHTDKDGHDRADIAASRVVKPDRSAVSLYLLLSQSCNLGCIYCLNGAETYGTRQSLKMREEVAYRGVERALDSLSKDGRLEIAFFGGEPLLNWPLAKQVIRHCEETLKPKYPDKHITYHLTSNLAVVPSDLIDWAKKYRITFLCDVDGPAPLHDRCRPYRNGTSSHADIVGNIRKLIDSGLSIALRTTVTAINQHHMLEIAKHHKAIGGRGSAFVPVNPVNSDEHILRDDLLPDPEVVIQGLVDIYQSKIYDRASLFPFSVYASKVEPGAKVITGCGAPYGNTPVVDVNGDAYPCIYLVGIKKFRMGNVLREDYPDTHLLEWMMDILHVDNIGECRDCAWRYLCGGGCPINRLTILDNPAVTPGVRDYCSQISCTYTKKILELLFWELATDASSAVKKTTPREAGVASDAVHSIRC